MWYFTIVCLVAQSLWLFLTPWTVACQAPLPMEFPRQEYWGGLPIAYSRGSSQSRDWNWVSCTGRWILYHCTSWEAHFTMTKPVLLCCAYWLSLTLRPMDYSPQAPLSMGVLQARILEWVAMPSSRESSQPRDWTQVSHTAAGFFTIWAIRETSCHLINLVCAKSFAWIILFNLQYIYCPLPTPPPILVPCFLSQPA